MTPQEQAAVDQAWKNLEKQEEMLKDIAHGLVDISYPSKDIETLIRGISQLVNMECKQRRERIENT